MKSKIFLWCIVVDYFLLVPSAQSIAIKEAALLNTIEQVVKKDADSCLIYDRVVHDLVNKITQSGHQDDDAVRLMRVLLEKQASILEKLQHRTIDKKSIVRFKIKPFEVLVVLLLVGILYGGWSYYWNSSYLELLEKLKDLLQPLFDWLQQLRDLLPAWGNASTDATEATEKTQEQYFSDKGQETTDTPAKQEQDFSGRECLKTPMFASSIGESCSVVPEKSYDNYHELPSQSSEHEQAIFHEIPGHKALVPDVAISQIGWKESVGSVCVGMSEQDDLSDSSEMVDARSCDIISLTYQYVPDNDLDTKYLKEVKKQQEEIMKLLGLTEMPQVSPEEIEVTKKQLNDMLTLEDHIVYAEYIMNKLDPEVRATLDQKL